MSCQEPNVSYICSNYYFEAHKTKNLKGCEWFTHTHTPTHTQCKSHKYLIENYNNEKKGKSKLKETQLSAKMDLILNNVTNDKQVVALKKSFKS